MVVYSVANTPIVRVSQNSTPIQISSSNNRTTQAAGDGSGEVPLRQLGMALAMISVTSHQLMMGCLKDEVLVLVGLLG